MLQPAQLTSFYPKTCGGTGERPFILSMCFVLGEGNTDGGLKQQPTTWTSQAQLEAAERLLLTKGMSRVRLLYKSVSPLGLFSGVGLAPSLPLSSLPVDL